MTLKVRRIISLIFIALFLLITPAIMLYAAGYRLGKNNLSIERTGMFIIDSDPEGATILLNDRSPQIWLGRLINRSGRVTTPAKIKNLLPGDYKIKLELNGYSGWQKTLTISPGASTFAENVRLFKISQPEKIADGSLAGWSPDLSQALVISPQGTAAVVNLAGGAEKTIANSGLKGKNLAWSADNGQVVSDGLLYDLNGTRPAVNINQLTPGAFNFQWSGSQLYYRDKNFLYRLSQSGQAEKITALSGDYLIKDETLYSLEPAESGARLKTLDPITGQTVRAVNLPLSAGSLFINPRHSLINLYDRGQQTLYLINLASANPLSEVLANLKISSWAGDDLLYANDFEIWLYRTATKEKILLTRISDTVNQAVLLPDKNYVVYATTQALKTVELDERDKRNLADLLKFDRIDSFVLSADGRTVYFSGQNGNETGVFKLPL